MQATFGNVLHNLPRDGSAEIVESLHACGGLKIERIISKEQASPPGFW